MTKLPTTKDGLVSVLQVDLAHFEKVLRDAPHSYQPYLKKKPNGGQRKIEKPADALKQIQAKINQLLLSKIDLLENVYPKKGTSQKNALKPHQNQPVVITLDIQDFFPSIKNRRLKPIFLKWFSPEVTNILLRLTTYRGHVPQGAPTSSALAGLYISDLVENLDGYLGGIPAIKISVFADDIIISGPEGLQRVISGIIKLAPRYGLQINDKIYVMRGKEQQALGACLSPSLHMPAEFTEEAKRVRAQGNEKAYRGKMAYKKFIEG